jgi:3-hydroxymyristoyl/3-hydroxydecanoyl-(acyl carrier protein) dehydratase
MLQPAERHSDVSLDRHEIEKLLPQRGTFLLIDAITHIDRLRATVACRYSLDRAGPILHGHFPGEPVWPGVLHVEAVGQAGLCLIRLLGEPDGAAPHSSFVLTHILGAHFIHPITPDNGDIEIVARVIPDGLFNIVIGQCLQRDAVCSAAVVRGISKETET